MTKRQAIPWFALYGEPPTAITGAVPSLDPVHMEELFVRAPANQWVIRPHRHAELHQTFWISKGGGNMRVEEAETAFEAPCLFCLPPGTVHGFAFRPGSEGHVLSLTGGFVAAQEAVLGQVDWLHRNWLALIPRVTESAVEQAFKAVQARYDEPHPGRHMAVGGEVLLLWSQLQTLAGVRPADSAASAAENALVRRFTGLIEAEYRGHLSLPEYARRLGVTPARLTRACRCVTGRSPLDLIHGRIMLEARRMLAYTAMGVAEVSHNLEFSDPAYFSRFFSRRYGAPPLAVQRAHTLRGLA